VNHAEPATLCGNVVDRTTPSPLSGRCPRVVLIYAPGSLPDDVEIRAGVQLYAAGLVHAQSEVSAAVGAW
jgi:hypothetical protein